MVIPAHALPLSVMNCFRMATAAIVFPLPSPRPVIFSSIPLTNCFQLAGISVDNISAKIYKLTNPAAISNLESLLSTSVTKHIKKVWPEHPISIKFEINDNNISLLVEDDGVMYKAKTTSQRSDGFRQFISFLLTLSAENQIEELNHTLMLIDEPEAHLHPQAQINLCKELIKITSNGTDNIAFYATHSNYMIDKNNLERNIKVVKKRNGTTLLEYIPASQSSFQNRFDRFVNRRDSCQNMFERCQNMEMQCQKVLWTISKCDGK